MYTLSHSLYLYLSLSLTSIVSFISNCVDEKLFEDQTSEKARERVPISMMHLCDDIFSFSLSLQTETFVMFYGRTEREREREQTAFTPMLLLLPSLSKTFIFVFSFTLPRSIAMHFSHFNPSALSTLLSTFKTLIPTPFPY